MNKTETKISPSRSFLWQCLSLVIFCLFAIFLSLSIGAYELSGREIISGILGRGSETQNTIIQDLRLPRTLLGGLIGAGLGASGAALQAFTRNPLADPGILGFNACAGLGAVGALYFSLYAWVVPAALFGALIGALVLLASVGHRHGANLLILLGVGLGALATAATGLLMNFAPNPWALSEIVYWMMGSLKNATLHNAYLCGGLTSIGIAMLLAIGPHLRTLGLGEDTAKSLGVPMRMTQVLLVSGVALCVGSGVAVAGAIGFIGLFIPHIIRAFFTPDPARILPLSALAGAGFLIFADCLTRLISVNGTVIYLGILTSLVGAPFFLFLAFRAKSL